MQKNAMQLSVLFLTIVEFCSSLESLLQLTNDDFVTNVQQHSPLLVLFYAPWCGHSKKLLKTIEEASSILMDNKDIAGEKNNKDSGVEMLLGTVDSTEEVDLSQRFNINVYPTLKMFVYGDDDSIYATTYAGGRNTDSIVDFVVRWGHEAVQNIDGEEDIDLECTQKSEYLGTDINEKGDTKETEGAGDEVEIDATGSTQETTHLMTKKNLDEFKFCFEEEGFSAVAIACEPPRLFIDSAEHFRGMRNSEGGVKFVSVGGEMCQKLTLNSDEIKLIRPNDSSDDDDRYFNPYVTTTMSLEVESSSASASASAAVATTAQDLLSFITTHTTPLVTHYDSSLDSANAVFFSPVKSHVILFLDGVGEGKEQEIINKELAEGLKTVAKDWRGKIKFVIAGRSEARLAEFFGISRFPSLLITKVGGGNIGDDDEGLRKYVFPSNDLFDTEASIKSTNDWIRAFLEGELRPTLRSEAADSSIDLASPVKIVKSETFDEMVMNSEGAVLLALYAPYCGHCKRLLPILDEVAERNKDEKAATIMKIDATANELDHEMLKVSRFPTLYFFPSGRQEKGHPLLYDGQHSVDEIMAFLASF